MILKAASAAVIALILFAAPASAGPSEDSLKAVDKALSGGDVPADQKAQVKDMRDQAASLCAAGNEQEGVDVLTETKAMLGLE